MAGQLLKTMQKNRDRWNCFVSYVKDKGLASTLVFAMSTERDDAKLYDTFFSNPPKVKVKGIDGFAKQARKVYIDRLDVASKQGMIASQGHAFAVSSPIFRELYESAKSWVTELIEKQVIREFLKSPTYRIYVSTQVDGPSLASKLGFPANAAKELADLKVSLIVGEKSRAQTCAKLAIDYEMKAKLKNKNPRHGVRFTKPADLIKAVDKIKIAV